MSHEPSFWSRLSRGLFGRPRAVHVLIALICAVIGFTLVAQMRAQQSDPLESLSEQDLVQILDELGQQEDQLREERADLNAQLADLRASQSNARAQREAARAQAREAEIAAGTLPVHGPGVRIRIGRLSAKVPVQVLVTTLGELRNAGAEAMQVGGVRLTARSWFASQGGTLVVDGEKLGESVEWVAIGDPDTLATALQIRGGAVAQLRAYGASVDVVRVKDASIDATASPAPPRWASVR